jgi:bacterioferritin-associated ferredoxin
MFVCICNAVSDGMITDSIGRRANTVMQVGRSCDARTGCVTCKCGTAIVLDRDRRQDLVDRVRTAVASCAQRESHWAETTSELR